MIDVEDWLDLLDDGVAAGLDSVEVLYGLDVVGVDGGVVDEVLRPHFVEVHAFGLDFEHCVVFVLRVYKGFTFIKCDF